MKKRNPLLRMLTFLLVLYLAVVALVYFSQRRLIYFPSQGTTRTQLQPWSAQGQVIGYCFETPHPQMIWLMLHGNAGQAAGRDYVLPHLSSQDSLYVLEYPGYGLRAGSPSRASIDQAAREAYQVLRTKHPGIPVGVLGESIGSGPASALAQETPSPDKIVLVVPYDSLANVAARRFFFLPVRLMLHDNWDNVSSLRHYAGPVEIYAARGDTIIPPSHAKTLADQVPSARFTFVEGDHNDWSVSDAVKIAR